MDEQSNNPLYGLGGVHHAPTPENPIPQLPQPAKKHGATIAIAGAIVCACLLAGGYRYYSDYRFNKYNADFEKNSQTLYAKEIELLKLENTFSDHINTGLAEAGQPDSTIQGIKNEFDSAFQDYSGYIQAQETDIRPLLTQLTDNVQKINREKLWISAEKKQYLQNMQSALEGLRVSWEKSLLFEKQTEPLMEETVSMLRGTAETIRMGTYAKTGGGTEMGAHIPDIANLKQYASPSYTFEGSSMAQSDYPDLYAFLTNSSQALGSFYGAMAAAQAGDMQQFNDKIKIFTDLETAISQAGSPVNSILKKEVEASDKPMIESLTAVITQVDAYNDAGYKKGFLQTGPALGKNRYRAELLDHEIALYMEKKGSEPQVDTIDSLLAELSGEGLTLPVRMTNSDFTYSSIDGKSYILTYRDDILNQTVTIEKK